MSRNENAVFLLNRFHLSAYVSTVIRQPELEQEYDEIINVLRTLPVHVFILQLGRNEIEQRSRHSERSSAWQMYQQGRVKKDGFDDQVERYLWQQKLIIEAAKSQRIPYSLIKSSSTRGYGAEAGRVPTDQSSIGPAVQTNTAAGKSARKKRDLPRSL